MESAKDKRKRSETRPMVAAITGLYPRLSTPLPGMRLTPDELTRRHTHRSHSRGGSSEATAPDALPTSALDNVASHSALWLRLPRQPRHENGEASISGSITLQVHGGRMRRVGRQWHPARHHRPSTTPATRRAPGNGRRAARGKFFRNGTGYGRSLIDGSVIRPGMISAVCGPRRIRPSSLSPETTSAPFSAAPATAAGERPTRRSRSVRKRLPMARAGSPLVSPQPLRRKDRRERAAQRPAPMPAVMPPTSSARQEAGRHGSAAPAERLAGEIAIAICSQFMPWQQLLHYGTVPIAARRMIL